MFQPLPTKIESQISVPFICPDNWGIEAPVIGKVAETAYEVADADLLARAEAAANGNQKITTTKWYKRLEQAQSRARNQLVATKGETRQTRRAVYTRRTAAQRKENVTEDFDDALEARSASSAAWLTRLRKLFPGDPVLAGEDDIEVDVVPFVPAMDMGGISQPATAPAIWDAALASMPVDLDVRPESFLVRLDDESHYSILQPDRTPTEEGEGVPYTLAGKVTDMTQVSRDPVVWWMDTIDGRQVARYVTVDEHYKLVKQPISLAEGKQPFDVVDRPMEEGELDRMEERANELDL